MVCFSPENENESEVVIRSATLADADAIAKLYTDISVHKMNYREILSDGEHSFAKRGGMFEISNSKQVAARISDPNEKVIVGCLDGDIHAVLWYGRWEEGLFSTLIPDQNNAEFPLEMKSEGRAGRLGYAKEIISVSPFITKILPMALFYDMMCDNIGNGLTHTVGEVYCVKGYWDADGFVERNLLNHASYNFLIASGGNQIGITERKKVDLDGFSVLIEPQIFSWDTNVAKRKIAQILSNEGWRVQK